MRNYITFAGCDLRNYGLYVSGSAVYNAPERAYEEITIPGRDSVVLGPEKRLENVEVVYPAFIYDNFNSNIAGLRSFLLSKIGYQRLVDTYHTNEYRLAYYRGGLDVEPVPWLAAGQFDLAFTCKPQRFLISGEAAVTYTSNGTIVNPTLFNSKPLLRVYGAGTITVGTTSLTITGADGYTDIDCDLMEAYKGPVSKNAYIHIPTVYFPELQPGTNEIGFSGNITRIDITPRWWHL